MTFKVTPIVSHKLTISAVGHGSQTVATSVDYSRGFRYLTTDIKKQITGLDRKTGWNQHY
jgi:hypothetical protein